MATLVLDYGRAGKLDFSLTTNTKTGKPNDARHGTELGLDRGVPPSQAFNYLCYRRSALRFCFIATAISGLLSVLQGAAANGSLAPSAGSRLPELNHTFPRHPPPPPAPPPPGYPPGSLSVDDQFALLGTINSIFVSVGKLVSTLSLAWAGWFWQDLKSSRTATIVSYVALVVPPFIMASVPWFLVLDMQGHYDKDPAPEHENAFFYRVQCGSLVYGGVSSAVLSLVPSLMKGVTAWKSVAPEMVLWGHLFYVLPILDVMLTYPTVCIGLQVLADPYFTTYTLWGIFAMAGFVYIARLVNTVEGLSSNIEYSLKQIGKASKVKLFLGVGCYGWLIGTFWPLIDAYFGSSANASNIIRICRAMGIDIWWLLQFLFNYYASFFVATLVGVDMLAGWVLSMREKDGMYYMTDETRSDRNYDGVTSVCTMFALKGQGMALVQEQSVKISRDV